MSREFEGGVELFGVDPHAAQVQRLAHTVSYLCREFFTRYPVLEDKIHWPRVPP
ncbi:MAG TPA: hypothetical protein VKA24_07930 [Gaiellaceae bacterium]|nr:hypothetical protein [Gaiellaceae bacterium]